MPKFSPDHIAAALAAAPEATVPDGIDWSQATITQGGRVEATLTNLRRRRGAGKRPAKEEVTIRLSPGVLAYFRAQGWGWPDHMDEM